MSCQILIRRAAVTLFTGLLTTQIAVAQAPEFYREKTINLVVGYGAGGGYDSYARLLARHLPRQIPGQPTIVVRNMPGAGSLNALNSVYGSSPQDGTSMVTFGPEVAFEPLRNGPGIMFDPLKLNWLGSLNKQVSIAVMTAKSGATSIEIARQTKLIVGASGSGSQSNLNPHVYNAFLGTQFKVITGFTGTQEMTLAMERGELDGIAGWSWDSLKLERPSWAKSPDIQIIMQVSDKRHQELPSVPNIYDLVSSEDDKRVLDVIFAHQFLGRPFAMPPGVPHQRITMIRSAFDAAVKDKALLEEADRIRLELDYVSGPEVEAHVKKIFSTPKPLIDRAASAIEAAKSAKGN
jgi:tripartite-type tricarboxylate transporter receptor subunit TctC